MREPWDRTSEVKASADGRLEIGRSGFCDAFKQAEDRLFSAPECGYCKYGDFGVLPEHPTETGVCKHKKGANGIFDSSAKRCAVDPTVQAGKKRGGRDKMKKRLLSILLTVCMVLTLLPGVALAVDDLGEYGLWVGTTNVTSTNASGVTGPGITGTVTYDTVTNTLTLNNASITETGHYGYAIGSHPGDLNIALIGSNTINLSSVASSNGAVIGIYSSGKVNIKSTVSGSLSIVSAPTTQDSNIGIYGYGGVTIEGCTVNAAAGAGTGPLDPACSGISVANGILSIKNATVTANGGTTAGNSYGINVDNGSVSIDSSTVTANSGNGTFSSYGISASTTTITISASTVTAAGNTRALSFDGAPTATGLTATASADKSGSGASAVAIDSSVYGLGSTYKYVQIAPALPSQQARWGVAGGDGTTPTEWTQGTLAAAISYANSSNGTYIQLLTDINKDNHTTWPLTFDSGNATVLDLNGKDINRGLTATATCGNVINIEGTALTLKDSSTDVLANQGKITGGFNSDAGGCVFVKSIIKMVDIFPQIVSGNFTMESGNITGNKITSTGVGGGGVLVESGCSFVMTGGSIAGNEALYWGGGVYVQNSGIFTMTGGSITDNTSENGGVYTNSSSFTVGGTAVIQDNMTTGANPVERNVRPEGSNTITASTATPLTSGASIGVTTATTPTSGNPVNVTGVNSNDYSGYFFSDNSSYMIKNGASNTVQLAVSPPVISTLSIPSSFTAGHYLALSELESYKPAITNNGNAISAKGWQIPTYPDGWKNWPIGVFPLDTSGACKLRYYATYSGGTVYSNEVTLNVVGITTALTLTATPEGQQVAGNSVTLTATLTGFYTGQAVNGQTITFKNGETTLGTTPLNSSGIASYTWTPSSEGAYSLTAAYAATPYNTAATSAAVNYTVEEAAPTITAGAATRTSDTTATVKFASGEGGTYYYSVGSAVTNTTTGGTAFTAGETTFSLTGLTAGAMDIYIVVKKASGKESVPTYKITIPALVGDTASTFGGLTVTYDGAEPTYNNNTLTLGTDTYNITGLTTIDRIKVLTNATANVTLSNVNIDLSGINGGCAFDMTAATVNLTLIGTNTLRSGNGTAGLLAPSGATLTVTAQSTGRLTAEATNIDGTGLPGAGIGGGVGSVRDCGTITINGGTIAATGGYAANIGTGGIGGAGIGGGGGGGTNGSSAKNLCAGEGGTVTINGGVVTATCGHAAADNGGSGAGIGGGGASGVSGDRFVGGRGGTVTINGGFVTAIGNNNSAGIGGGGSTPSSGLAGGSGGYGGTVVITGGTIIATGGAYRGAGIGGGGGSFSGTFADVTITGGSIKAKSGIHCAAPIGNGAAYDLCENNAKIKSAIPYLDASLYILTLPNVSSETVVTALTFTPPLGYTYGTTDMKTDADGKLYLYLPKSLKASGQSKVLVATAAGTYESSITGDTVPLSRVVFPVSGKVTPGTTGASVSGLTVNFYASSDTSFSTSMGSAKTDKNGGYYNIKVPSGNYVARVAGVSGSYAASVSNTIVVNDGAVSDANITLASLTTKSITVKAGSQKTAYTAGDSLNIANLKITVIRSDDFTYDKTVTADMVSGFDSSIAAASQTLTITFDGQTTTYTIFISRAAYSGSNAPTPSLISKTDIQVVLGAVTVDGQTVEYGKSTQKDIAPTDWQPGTTFTELTAGTTYYFFARVKQTGAMEAGGVSTATLSVTTKNEVPAAPPLAFCDITANSVNITPVTGAQYSKDGGLTWQDNGNFTDLSAATQYIFAIRIKETDDTAAGAATSVAQYTAAAAPSASEGYTIDYSAETISIASGFEVSGGAPSAITPGGTLNIRVKATSAVSASGWTTITIPERPATTGLSITATRTDKKITVAAITGAEYSKDGGMKWQSSNEFTELEPDKEYIINIRYAATASSFASLPLGSATIKTKTTSADTPDAPIIRTDADEPTSSSITISAVAGNEYYISTSSSAPATWPTSGDNYFKATVTDNHTFTGLTAGTKYYVYVRIAETDTAAPSGSSSTSAYTAAVTPSAGVGYTINYSAETISITSGYEVSSDSSFASDKLLSNGAAITPGATYYVRKALDTTTPNIPVSAAVSLTLPARAGTPAATGHAETVNGKNDGMISGVTAAMEWKAAGGTYAAVTTDQVSNGITGLSDGTYYVRYMAASGTGFKSAEQEVTIAVGHTITVTFNSQSGSDVAGITGKVYGDSAAAPADPTRSGFYFAGWYKEAACTNVWTFTLDTLTDDITLFAKWNTVSTYTVTGRIVDDKSHVVEGATVRIIQGATQYGTTSVTDTNGDFAIDNVPPGTYNLVITQGTRTAIIKVTVSSGNVAIGNATLPAGNANSILVVNGSDTPDIVVGGLDSEAGAQLANSNDPHDIVEIILTVEEKDASTAAKGSEVTDAIKSAGKQVGMILGIDVRKTINGTEDTSYNQTNGLIEIIIPLPAELQGKETYAIYRYHGAGVDVITETATDGERIVVDRTNWTMTLYTQKFSTYAIGYTNPASSGGGSSSSTSYTITASAGEGGIISPSGKVSVTGGSTIFIITANKSYEITDVKVDGISVGAVSSYTFSDVSASHTLSAVFAKITGLPYYIENGKMIFIGFASDASGTMKYVAPDGMTVLFKNNAKSFSDISGHWAKNYIDFVAERELFIGTGNATFSPQSGMTRAMFATVIGRLYERSYGTLQTMNGHAFTDADYSDYYGAYVDWAAENGIITGIGGGLFEPDREITREEMAAILYRFAKFLKVFSSNSETKLNYPDAADISSWAREAAIYCQQTEIITGRCGGNFVPQGNATRAEVAAILQRFIESALNN